MFHIRIKIQSDIADLFKLFSDEFMFLFVFKKYIKMFYYTYCKIHCLCSE